jgi:hypothetical protein
VLVRIRYSERVGTISQKVPTNWRTIARTTSARICGKAIEINANDVLNMDETFIHFYQASRVLAPTDTKRIGTLASVENDKKGVTVAVTARLLVSQLLPPFIIDTGGFGADLMKSGSITRGRLSCSTQRTG